MSSLKKNSKPGDAFMGFGAVAILLAVVVGIAAAMGGGSGLAALGWLVVGVLLVGVGYLRRNAKTAENRG